MSLDRGSQPGWGLTLTEQDCQRGKHDAGGPHGASCVSCASCQCRKLFQPTARVAKAASTRLALYSTSNKLKTMCVPRREVLEGGFCTPPFSCSCCPAGAVVKIANEACKDRERGDQKDCYTTRERRENLSRGITHARHCLDVPHMLGPLGALQPPQARAHLSVTAPACSII